MHTAMRSSTARYSSIYNWVFQRIFFEQWIKKYLKNIHIFDLLLQHELVAKIFKLACHIIFPQKMFPPFQDELNKNSSDFTQFCYNSLIIII